MFVNSAGRNISRLNFFRLFLYGPIHLGTSRVSPEAWAHLSLHDVTQVRRSTLSGSTNEQRAALTVNNARKYGIMALKHLLTVVIHLNNKGINNEWRNLLQFHLITFGLQLMSLNNTPHKWVLKNNFEILKYSTLLKFHISRWTKWHAAARIFSLWKNICKTQLCTNAASCFYSEWQSRMSSIRATTHNTFHNKNPFLLDTRLVIGKMVPWKIFVLQPLKNKKWRSACIPIPDFGY